MATIQQDIIENSGLIKEFDVESTDMLMQIVQVDLYTKPIESSIRETFSNALDAITEKNIALSILSGQAKVEDYFSTEGDKYSKSSSFNPEYYDVKYLQGTSDKVHIYYKESSDSRDEIVIEDFGVGLANGRLKGYFAPGYSSKRLSKTLTGKYGLGNKSPLATNIDFYVVESFYNGHYTKFMVYENFYKCIIPEEGATLTTFIEGKKLVDGVEVPMTEPIYWTDTDRMNGVRISFEVKKHNKPQFLNAIKDQLLYFKSHLIFYFVDAYGNETRESNMFANILQETSSYIISDNSRFTKPHILINNINYGIIDWAELGVNVKYGNIALKAGPSDVDITASRESVKWTEKTKKFILDAAEQTAIEAGNELASLLKQYTNPFERFIQANSDKLNIANSPNARVITALKGFAGEVKVEIKVDVSHLLSPTEIKAGVPTEINIAEIMPYLNNYTHIQNIQVSGNRISGAAANSISGMTMDKTTLFSISNKGVKGIPNLLAFYWGQKHRFQYVLIRDVEAPLMSKEEAEKHKISYKKVLKNHYTREVARRLFLQHIKASCTDIEEISEETLREFKISHRIETEGVLAMAESVDGTVTTNMTAKDARTVQDDHIRELKRIKAILPYRELGLGTTMYRIPTAHRWAMNTIKSEDLADIKGNVVYATQVDKNLLVILAKLLYNQGKFTAHLTGMNHSSIYTCVLIAEDNIKHFDKLDNFMHVQKFFKEYHKVEEGILHLKGGAVITNFLTTVRIYELLEKNPIFLNINVQSDSFTRFKAMLEIHAPDDLIIMNTFYEHVKRIPAVTDETSDFKERVVTSLQTGFDKDSTRTLLNTLINFTKLQDIPVGEEIEDAEVGALVQNFKGYEIQFYDKTLVHSIEDLIIKYEEVVLLFTELTALECSKEINNFTKLKLSDKINEQITEFFNQLNN